MTFKIIAKTEILRREHLCSVTNDSYASDSLEIFKQNNHLVIRANIDGSGGDFEIPLNQFLEIIKNSKNRR